MFWNLFTNLDSYLFLVRKLAFILIFSLVFLHILSYFFLCLVPALNQLIDQAEFIPPKLKLILMRFMKLVLLSIHLEQVHYRIGILCMLVPIEDGEPISVVDVAQEIEVFVNG